MTLSSVPEPIFNGSLKLYSSEGRHSINAAVSLCSHLKHVAVFGRVQGCNLLPEHTLPFRRLRSTECSYQKLASYLGALSPFPALVALALVDRDQVRDAIGGLEL